MARLWWTDLLLVERCSAPRLPVGDRRTPNALAQWTRRVLCCVAGLAAMLASTAGAASGESVEFTNAVLLTPARTNLEQRLHRFAPLLVIETAATNHAGLATRVRIGAIEQRGESVRINWQRPTVYGRADAIAIQGQPFERYSYVWWHPSGASNQASTPEGIRITATSAGQPLAFEILDGASGGWPVVVAQALEAAAARQYHEPLPGRRFAIERAAGDPLDATVLRVIDDGPLELGPVVYLRAGGGVATVICRCMRSQAHAIAATGYYDLIEPERSVEQLMTQARRQLPHHPQWWPGQSGEDPRLDTLLRLPTRLPGSPETP